MVARPPRPRFHPAEVLPVFVVWSENPAGTWLQLPRFFAGELPAMGPGALCLQADGCCSKSSWVAVEVSVAGNAALARGWQVRIMDNLERQTHRQGKPPWVPTGAEFVQGDVRARRAW